MLALFVAVRPALAADEMLQLEVRINGASIQKIGEFILRDGMLLARPEELAELGLRVAADAHRTADGLVVISALPGVTFSLDQAGQMLWLNAGAGQLIPHRLGAETGSGATGRPWKAARARRSTMTWPTRWSAAGTP